MATENEFRAPLPPARYRSAFDEFLTAMRYGFARWGVERMMSLSFYNIWDTDYFHHKADLDSLSLYAFLHYTLLTHGVVKVLETGTYNGVSTAAIATAVGEHVGGKVVSIDYGRQPICEEFLAYLPQQYRDAIELVSGNSLTVMADMVNKGECYDAAFLDASHVAEDVWTEFCMATKLVSPDGLILIHDANNTSTTAPFAMERIRDAGYPVNVHFLPTTGDSKDRTLGLAIIQNRKRALYPRPHHEYPEVTVAVMLTDKKIYGLDVFTKSVDAVDYPHEKIRLIVSIEEDSPVSEDYIKKWLAHKPFRSVTVETVSCRGLEQLPSYRPLPPMLQQFARLGVYRQWVLERYLEGTQDYGLVFWDVDQDWDPRILKEIVDCGWPIVAGVWADRILELHSIFNLEGHTLRHLSAEEIYCTEFTNYSTGGALFMRRDKWRALQDKGGYTDYVPVWHTGDDGIASLKLDERVYQLKHVGSWHHIDAHNAVKCEINGKVISYPRKSKKVSPMPLVGVVLNLDDRVTKETLEALRKQALHHFTCVIVAHNRDAKLLAELQVRDDPRFKVVLSDQKPSCGTAWNLGLAALDPSATYVLFLEDGEILEHHALELLYARACYSYEYDAVCGLYRAYDQDNNPLALPEHVKTGDVLFSDLAEGSGHLTPGAALFKRSALDRLQGFNTGCDGAEAWDLWLRLTAQSKVLLVNHHVVRRPVTLNREDDLALMSRCKVALRIPKYAGKS